MSYTDDLIEELKQLHTENKILREGFVSIGEAELKSLQAEYSFDLSLNGFYSNAGVKLEDELSRNAEKYGGRWTKLSPADMETQKLKEAYRPYFDPDSKLYERDIESTGWYKRYELFRKNRRLAEELSEMYKQK